MLREQNGALLAQLRLLLTRQDEDRARDVRRRWLRESHIRGLESGRPFDGACTRQDMSPDDGAGVDSSVVRHMASRLARHRALLAGIFGCATTTVGVLPPRQHGVMDEVENMDLDKLRTLPAYKAWSAPEAPASLWYVHGSNHSSLTLVDQCWFEGAIVDLVEWLRRGSGEKGSDDMQTVNSGEKEKTVVEEHATTGSDAPLDEKQPVSDNTNPVTSPTAPPSSPRRIVLPVLCTPHTTPTDVLKCALAQLLEQRPGLLRDAAAMHELESCVAPVVPEMNENPYAGERKLPRPPEDYSRALRGLLALLRRKVDSFADDLNGTDASDGDGTGAVGGKDIPSLPAPVDDVFIVLLRPEYCCDETVAGAKGRSTATTWRLLRTLLELVQDVENDVKADLTGGDVGSAVVVASEKSASPSSMASDKAVVRPDEVKMKNKEDKKTDDAGGAGACRLRVLFVAKRDLWDVEPRLGDLRAELREGSRLLVSALEQGVVDGGW